jgi:hypothetical protein
MRVRLGSSRLFVNIISSSLHLRPYSASRKRERTADHDKIAICAPQALGGRRPHRARLACMAPLVPPVEEETNGERRFRSCPWALKTSTPRSDVLHSTRTASLGSHSLSSSTLSRPSSYPRPNPRVSNQHRTPFPVVCSRRRLLCRIQSPALDLRRTFTYRLCFGMLHAIGNGPVDYLRAA